MSRNNPGVSGNIGWVSTTYWAPGIQQHGRHGVRTRVLRVMAWDLVLQLVGGVGNNQGGVLNMATPGPLQQPVPC